MKYRDFLREVDMIQLRSGKDGIRLVGAAQFDETTNKFRLGLIVPDARWSTAAEWEAAYRDAADKDGSDQPTDGRTVSSNAKAADT